MTSRCSSRRKKDRPLQALAVLRVVRQAAKRAGIPKKGLAVTGCVTRMPAMRSIAVRRSTWLRKLMAIASIATTGKYLHARAGESSGCFLAL
jgi:hypothetical protein